MQQEALENKTQEAISSGRPSLLKSAYEYTEMIIWSLLFIVLLFTFIVRVVQVSGHSMDDTLHDSEMLVAFNWFIPQDGDIVAIAHTQGLSVPIIKRVIATEGQTVNINFENGDVTVDGKLLKEDYIRERTAVKGDVAFPVTVPKGQVFVMGDNRNHSEDSRFSDVGMVDNRYIFGKVIFRLFPFNRISAF